MGVDKSNVRRIIHYGWPQVPIMCSLQYKCATCRGECYQVRDLEDAVQELWKRRDIFDRDLIAKLRSAAGLPTQEEIFSISPFSDDEDSGPIAPKNEYGRSVKFSLKRLVDKSPTCPVEQEFIIYSNQYFCE
ncbi:uncharacterized protein LOC108200403 isoform X2 [Daucus carota subsp. sativus]|uniref:uncharacterized protein LOC108200403 isoform X2 n=1 Tax=Daucus carota subsp. sativus TaxID=79200 RepID=UPI0007EFFF51|nr:PREDICTED: uncharacterized protein LOC108200403 isoform X2 [Daucus carota subsp. sativus]